MSDLDVISPPTKTVTVGGREIALFPLKVRQLPIVLRAFRPVLATLSDRFDLESIIGAYCDNATQINEALSCVSGLAVAEIEELPLDDAIALFAGALEVNRDFFSKTLPSLLGQKRSDGTGPTQ